MKLKFSIRYKILSVVTALLVTAIGLYLALATRVFQQDKAQLVFDLNKSVVTTLATQINTTLKGASEKLRLYALLSPTAIGEKKNLFQEIMGKDSLIVRMELVERQNRGEFKNISTMDEVGFSKVYGISSDFFSKKLLQQRPVPFHDIQTQGVKIWNATIADGPPLIGMGQSVIREGAHGSAEKVLVVVAYLRADDFLKNLKASTLTQAFVVTPNGQILIHPEPQVMAAARDMSISPIVKELLASPFQTGVKRFSDGDIDTLGAYSKVGFAQIGVVSEVRSQVAFDAVKSLVRRSILFAAIIVTITFIATVFFSRTLTGPLSRLMGAMEKVSDGNLTPVLEINTGDEIAVLARSFNQMTSDLKDSRNQLEDVNRDLEQKVVDRTKKLEEQNRAVKQAQEALLRTTRLAAVGEVAGRTAHEVLNPLTSLMTRIQRVQKHLTDEILTHKNLLGDIVKAWEHEYAEKGLDGFMESLKAPSQIDPKMPLIQEDLKNISQVFSTWDRDLDGLNSDTQFLFQQATRIEKILGQMRSLTSTNGTRKKISAHETLHEAANILADLFNNNKIKLIEEYSATKADVLCDRDELIQALTNLLRNSLQAVLEARYKSGEGWVRLSTQTQGEKLLIDISDNGIGISPANQTKLFEHQFTTKSPESGTGLGLSISRRFIRAFSGDLFLVESKPGIKTCFRIELPLAVEEKKGSAA